MIKVYLKICFLKFRFWKIFDLFLFIFLIYNEGEKVFYGK